MNSKIINSIKQFVIAVLTIVLALAVGAILVRISGNDPAEAYTTLFRGEPLAQKPGYPKSLSK